MPGRAGTEVVTKVYDPPWGPIAPLQLEQGGRAVIPADYAQQLRRAMTDIADKTNVRLRFVGYTKNERLDRRTAIVYGDDIGLAAARARRAMDTIVQEMQLTAAQAEHEGRGYVQSSDVVNEGFTQGGSSHIVVQVVYDEPAVLDDYEGVDIETADARAEPEESVRAEPDAHHSRRRADRRSGPQLGGHPALHRRCAGSRRHPVPVRQPAIEPAPERRRRGRRRCR